MFIGLRRWASQSFHSGDVTRKQAREYFNEKLKICGCLEPVSNDLKLTVSTSRIELCDHVHFGLFRCAAALLFVLCKVNLLVECTRRFETQELQFFSLRLPLQNSPNIRHIRFRQVLQHQNKVQINFAAERLHSKHSHQICGLRIGEWEEVNQTDVTYSLARNWIAMSCVKFSVEIFNFKFVWSVGKRNFTQLPWVGL